jgi:hypothetical protein
VPEALKVRTGYILFIIANTLLHIYSFTHANWVRLQSCSSPNEFMQKLPSFDQDWARQRHEAEAAGEVSKPFSLS